MQAGLNARSMPEGDVSAAVIRWQPGMVRRQISVGGGVRAEEGDALTKGGPAEAPSLPRRCR